MKTERVEIELEFYEFEALMANRMISDMCGRYLKSAKERGAGASHDTILEETPVENVLAMFKVISNYKIQ